MSVNLAKNKEALLKAWEEIHNPKGKNDWVIFGYEGLSCDLKVVSQGEDGIEEMVDYLNGGKILYVGLRIIDPNSNLPKVVFINWQGEGVPATFKGKCANHLRDITNLFRGFHVQINARNEDDIDEDTIKDKVKNASGAKFGIHKEKPQVYAPQGPIGSVYQKSKPHLDTGIKEKDTFWKQNQKEEIQRKEEEAKQLEEQKMKESRLRSEREKTETDRRHKEFMERSKSIDEQRNMTVAEQNKKLGEEEKKRYKEVMVESRKDDEEFRKRSESDRKKRLQEANMLIKQRNDSFDEAKDMFEKPATQAPPPQVAPKKKKAVLPPPATPSKPQPANALPPVPQFENKPVEPSPEPVRVPSPEPVREPSPEPVPSPKPVSEPSPKTVSESAPELVREPSPEPEQQEIIKRAAPPAAPMEIRKELPAEPNEETVAKVLPPEPEINRDLPPEPVEDNLYDEIPTDEKEDANLQDTIVTPTATATESNSGITARALYDYQAVDASEITFDPGDMITGIEKIDDGWWRGFAPNGGFGMFPSNYVEEVTADGAPQGEPQGAPQEEVSYDYGQCATALYDYQATDETEITFDPGDTITNIEQIDAGWWRGYGPAGNYGLFPANYVELV